MDLLLPVTMRCNDMLNKIASRLLFGVIALALGPAGSAFQPQNIVWQHYQPNLISRLYAHSGMITQIVFGQDERIVSIQNGDLAAWMVNVDHSAPNMLFIKPTLQGSDTNMTVVTDQHSYYFHLVSEGVSQQQHSQPYAIQFLYDKGHAKSSQAMNKLHDHYSYSGNASIRPTSAYDDGRFIYLRFNQQQPLPAVFAVFNNTGHETMVNVRYHDHTLIVEELAPQLTLRLGRRQIGSVFNDDWIHLYVKK